jgi:hypothetical protein
MLMQLGEVRLVLLWQGVLAPLLRLLLPLLLLLQEARRVGWQHQRQALAWVQQQVLQQSSLEALLLLLLVLLPPSHLQH